MVTGRHRETIVLSLSLRITIKKEMVKGPATPGVFIKHDHHTQTKDDRTEE